MPDPIWTPYDPDRVIGEFGWLWLEDGPMGPEWRLVITFEDSPEDLRVWGCAYDEDIDGSDRAETWRGTPYLSCSAPTAEPHKSDALEVTIRMEDGASLTYSIGAGRGADQLSAALNTILNPVTRGRPALDVLAERRRQINEEGWTPDHDDAHDNAELAMAAACYALVAGGGPSNSVADRFWPFDHEWWKPTDRRSNLVKAAALILAEIERIDREGARRG